MNNKFPMGDLPSFHEIEQGISSASHRESSSSPLNPERFMIDESVIDRDYIYLKKICPPVVGQISDSIEEECDRLEYEGSFLFDQYPDKTTLYKMVDRISQNLPSEITVNPKDLIQALLCDEMFYRRCRYYRKKKQFQ